MSSPLVSSQWLAERVHQADLFILDASVEKVVGKEAILYPHFLCLPEAYSLDVDRALSTPGSAAPHGFPPAEQVQAVAEQIGFTPRSTLVIYDNQGIYSAPRAWWILKMYGFEQVYVLDGGLPQWLAEQRPTAGAYRNVSAAKGARLPRKLSCRPQGLTAAAAILANLETPAFLLVDVRARARFYGQVAEPRPGLRRGHIPGSLNVPFHEVLDATRYKTQEELAAIFSALPMEKHQPVVFSCGSGMTACIVLLAAALVGFKDLSLYDGSWSEWGADAKLPISAGQ